METDSVYNIKQVLQREIEVLKDQLEVKKRQIVGKQIIMDALLVLTGFYEEIDSREAE